MNGVVQEWAAFSSADVSLPVARSSLAVRPYYRLHLKCYGTRAETRFRLSAKRASPFKSAGASVQLNTGNRGVRISGSNAGHTMFRGGVKSTGYPLHSPVSSSLSLSCVTVCYHISTGLYMQDYRERSVIARVMSLAVPARVATGYAGSATF
jgi:hypothetical protein